MLGIMLIAVLMVVGGMMLDFSKAQMLKSSYIDAAKKATQSGSMQQNSRGAIKAEAFGVTVNSYEEVMRPAIINTEGYFSKCENYNEEDVVLKVTFTEEYFPEENSRVGVILESRSLTIGREEANLLGSSDAINNKYVDGTQLKSDIDSGAFRPNLIMVELTEGTENTVLPAAFKITGTGNSDGMKCQKINVAARASTFLGDEQGAFD